MTVSVVSKMASTFGTKCKAIFCWFCGSFRLFMAFAGFISYSKVGCISGGRFILISAAFSGLKDALFGVAIMFAVQPAPAP